MVFTTLTTRRINVLFFFVISVATIVTNGYVVPTTTSSFPGFGLKTTTTTKPMIKGVVPLMTKTIRHRSLSSSSERKSSNMDDQEVQKVKEEKEEKTVSAATKYSPLFDFTKDDTINRFDRIDDAIMGGISTSSMRNVPAPGNSHSSMYASWSGVCREDGGGFCGTRTLPFEEPINVGNDYDGIYIDCKFASDNEANRRVWKVSLRTDKSRGQELFQSEFKFENNNDNNAWERVTLPFIDFKRVSGARLIDGFPPMNITENGGIYQIGMTMSKFITPSGGNMTAFDNFRSGYFETHIKEIGLFSKLKDEQEEEETMPIIEKLIIEEEPTAVASIVAVVDATAAATEEEEVSTEKTAMPTIIELPRSITKEESNKNRPVIAKVMFTVAKLFFSEKANRRKSTMKILREKRGYTRLQAILYGIAVRRRSNGGLPKAIVQTIQILSIDTIRIFTGALVKYGIFGPLIFLNKMKTKKEAEKKRKEEESSSNNNEQPAVAATATAQ